MANINGATITSTVAQPNVHYYTTSSTTRTSNSNVNVTFKIKARLGGSGDWLGTGHTLIAYFTVGGTQKSVTVKESASSWTGSSWRDEVTLNFGAVASSSAGAVNITFSVSNTYGTAGRISATTYQLTMPPLLTTACIAPTSFSASPLIYEDKITLTWSGAAGGTDNAISSYEIQAATFNGSVWGAWIAWSTVSSSSTSGSNETISSITRGYDIKFRIRTRGAAGSSYYSGWKESGSVRRNSLPTVPLSILASPASFEVSLTVSWGSSSDPNGNLWRYELQYRTSANGTSWGAWTALYNGTATSYAHTPPIEDGAYIQYRVRAVDTLGAASDYRESSAVLRDDGAGFSITVGGTTYKAKAYISTGGAVYKAKPFLSSDNTVFKGKS